MSSGGCCCEEVIQPKLEGSIGYDLHQGDVQAGVQPSNALPADYAAGCIQHTPVDLYAAPQPSVPLPNLAAYSRLEGRHAFRSSTGMRDDLI